MAHQGATRFIRRPELFTHRKTALEALHEFLSTGESARHVISAEGWDAGNRRLRITVAHGVATMMTRYERRGPVRNEGLRESVTPWRLP